MTSLLWFSAGMMFGIFVMYGYIKSRLMMGRWVEMIQQPEVHPAGGWILLPSGWSKTSKGLDAYIMPYSKQFYWFINRQGHTIIEGPARSFDLAMIEVEAAMSDFGRA
jgi:hypothetical protein